MAVWVGVFFFGCMALAADKPESPEKPAPIKLGIIISKFTATGPHWIDKPYGYGNQMQRLSELKDPGIEWYPVIEPGTEIDKDLAGILLRTFPGKTPINGYDATELKKLDVVLGHMICNMQDKMATALTEAVKDGLGLVQQSGGSVTPGYTPAINQLAGMVSGDYGWNPRDVDCEVVGTHPLLGNLSGNIGAIISARPNGHFGELIGIPLLRVKERTDVFVPRGTRVAADFYPLYVSQLGKGRIVGIGLAHYVATPRELQAAHNNRFFIHCVQWAAGRKLD